MSSCWIIIFGILVIAAIVVFAIVMYYYNWLKQIKTFVTFCFSDEKSAGEFDSFIEKTKNIYPQFWEKRNEFWLFFGQIIVAVIIAIIITILLLEEKIDKAAGISLLSALGGFTIAKGVNFNPPKMDKEVIEARHG